MQSLEKRRPVRLQKIRDSARGQDCTIRSQYCNGDPDTVVFAHYGEPGEKGMGLKPDDTSGAYACEKCHSYLDRRNHVKGSQYEEAVGDTERRWLWFRGMRETWRLLVVNGVLK